MASKKDMKRTDLIVPFIEPKSEKPDDMSSMLTTTVPMAAIFTRNKMIGWVAVVFAIQSWLAESPAKATSATSGTSGILSVGMAFMSLIVAYMPMFMPPQGTLQSGSSTQAQAAVAQ